MIYFDNNATTRLAPEVLEAMMPFMTESFGNPSSAYSIGREGRVAVERARESVAKLIGAPETSEIVFTSCGTESDNWAIFGAVAAASDKRGVITTAVEHEAVRLACDRLEAKGYEVTRLGVDETGALDLAELEAAFNEDTALVSVMLANNETGVLFPVEEIARVVKQRSNALVHVDGVNAAGKVPIDLKNGQIDLFSISAHKFHGPKGIGALYIRGGVNIVPASVGGGQERGRRAGTEAVHQIAGIGRAAELVMDLKEMPRVEGMRDRLVNEILETIPNSRLNGTDDPARRLPNTANISFENTNGEAILAMLDDKGICVSTGSACHASDHSPSPVLTAMQVPYSAAMGSIRFSLGRYNTDAEVTELLGVLPETVARLRSLSGAA